MPYSPSHHYRAALVLLALLPMPSAWAQCWPENTDNGKADYFLANGIVNQPIPEIIFDLPSNSIGSGGRIISTTVNNRGGNQTLTNHVRFRLSVSNKTTRRIVMSADSTTPLSCTTCSSSVTIPFSKIGWQENNANETKGSAPADGQFNNGIQTWVSANPKDDHVFNLQFDFLNDTIYPAGTYTGEFRTRGTPQ